MTKNLFSLMLCLFLTMQRPSYANSEIIKHLNFDQHFSTLSSYRNLCEDEQKLEVLNAKDYNNICEFVLNSQGCQDIAVDERIRCDRPQDNNINVLSWSFINHCAVGLYTSLVEFVRFLKDVVVWSVENFDQEKRTSRLEKASIFQESLRNYIAIEYAKEMDEYEGHPMQKVMAAQSLFGHVLKTTMKSLVDIIETGYTNLGCYRPAVRAEKLCRIIGDITMPPAAAVALIMRGPMMLQKLRHYDTKMTLARRGDPEVIGLLTRDREASTQMLELGQKLRASSIDPKHTHIPEFAAKAQDHLEYFKSAIISQADELDRLKIIEEIATEMNRRISNEAVTYEWWIAVNHRLSLLATPSAKRSPIVAGTTNSFDELLLETGAWVDHGRYMAIKRTHQADLAKSQIDGLSAVNAEHFFPNEILIPSIHNQGNLSIGLLNDIHGEGLYPIGLARSSAKVDGREMFPDQFFRHDIVHAANDRFFLNRTDRTRAEMQNFANKYRQYRETIPVDADRRAAFEFGYFFITHEIGIYADDVMRGTKGVLAKRDDMAKLITDPTWFGQESLIPVWARKDEVSAKKFMEMVTRELDTFAESFN